MTTTVSFMVLILALEIPFTELERGKKTVLPVVWSLILFFYHIHSFLTLQSSSLKSSYLIDSRILIPSSSSVLLNPAPESWLTDPKSIPTVGVAGGSTVILEMNQTLSLHFVKKNYFLFANFVSLGFNWNVVSSRVVSLSGQCLSDNSPELSLSKSWNFGFLLLTVVVVLKR